MASAPRLIISGKVYELTFRTEEALPLICTLFMCKILKGQLAAAASRYSIQAVAYVYMGNHVHMLVVVDDPGHLPLFVAYLKRESAHAINNLLGRNQHTVWKDGYDPVVILDAEKLVERLVYFYLNPVRANLVDSIDEYPGVSSWVNGFQERFTLLEDYIPREVIPVLRSPSVSEREDLRLTHYLAEKATTQHSVEIDCLGWMDCFAETRGGDRTAMAHRIREAVYAEQKFVVSRRESPALGASELRLQSIRKWHEPKKIGRRILCMGSDVSLRCEVISWFKSLFRSREEKRKLLSPQEFLTCVFPGFFKPGNLLVANLNPAFVPF